MNRTEELIAQVERVSAHNYAPLPIVLSKGSGVWAWDTNDRRYLDCLSAYSSLSLGHCHPKIVAALTAQAQRLSLTSRAFHNDRMGPFLELLCRLCRMDMALPMNTGAEAVETAIKLVRKWGYRVKGVPRDCAEIIVCRQNFHGRTTTIVGFSSESAYRDDFGPYGPGFTLVDFGDTAALEAAISPHTVAFLVEPIQAEAGINIPPPGYLSAVRRICSENNVLLVLDEIQTGLGRTGRFLAHEHEAAAAPDVLIVGKALGGGVYPVSAVLASAAILGLIQPGEHGSTFGGNPLAAAVGTAALEILQDDALADRAATLGDYLLARLRDIEAGVIADIRGRGLLIGIELAAAAPPARDYCTRLLERGVLTKDTHERVIRLAPPLIIERSELDWLVEQLTFVLTAAV
jgi:ornithine--oxo-acid transaminase